ncbi:hypothetical protein GCM10011579_098290 [Streptomyces albiflavescens]|uniref:Transposase n=1 Tax=Streptomyces albiflavescens TaxID=1623582 RepID=A0A917YIE5_9ACTN|nr:hypothetical protein GCM10011579_098290 [Streptomyces albiflavescens]
MMRARMIELSWSGLRVPAIAVELDCSQKTVRCWLHRFNRSGLQGLEDLGVQGRKRRITEEDRSRIIFLVKNRAARAAEVGARRGTVGLRRVRAIRVDVGFPGRGSAGRRDRPRTPKTEWRRS